MKRYVIALLAVALAGCSADETQTKPDPKPKPKPPSIEALYGAAAQTMLTPYPSDRYTVADAKTRTGRRVKLDAGATADPLIAMYTSVAQSLSEMDGFSTSGGAVAMFSGPVDVRGIVQDLLADPPIAEPARDAAEYTKKDAPFLLVDVDPKSPERGKARGLIPRWWAQAKDDYYTNDEFTLVAQPATPLLPSTRYLFVVTNQLKAADGGEIGRSADTEALIAGKTGDDYGAEMLDALDELEGKIGVPRDDVVLATVFTTASILDETLAMAKAARASQAPAASAPWTVETAQSPPDPRVRFRTTYPAPEYRRALPVGTWEIADGKPVTQKTVDLEVFLAFSDATKSGPRPVVIYQHGLGGDKDGCWGTAERLSELGAAVIAIDSPEHGSRGTGSPAAALFSFFGVDQASQTFDIARARDNFRQMTSDQLELVRFIGTLGTLDLLPVGAPDGVPDLDVSRILYIGHSFGSVQGPAVFALAPEITQATWNVGGDGLMMLLRDSGTFKIIVNSLRPPHTADGALGRFFATTQAIVDPGDPLNYARFASLTATPDVDGWKPRDVLLQMVMGDSIVPNSTSEALARAAGLTLVDPIQPISGLAGAPAPVTGNTAGGGTGAIVQFDYVEGGKMAEHGGLIFTPEARAQYVEFFKTGLAQPHATVVPAYPPGPHK